MFKRLIQLKLAALVMMAPLSFAQVSDNDWSLDAIVDTRAQSQEGLPVLAITPNGAAEKIGLKPGDRLIQVNGMSLSSGSNAQRTLAYALNADSGHAKLLVLREGESLELSGALNANPPTNNTLGCGYVSDDDKLPNISGNIWKAEITQVDGRSTPLHGKPRLKIEAGQHVLVVRELIPDRRFKLTELHERNRMQRLQSVRAYKALVVDIQPGFRYSIGAKLIEDKLDTESIRNNDYWEPVIYSEREENCK